MYPEDFTTKDGKLFWTLPKRYPLALKFNFKEEMHLKFIKSYARLFCRIWGLDEKLLAKTDFQSILESIKIKPFKPKDSEIEEIRKQVEKENKKEDEVEEEEEEVDEEEIKK